MIAIGFRWQGETEKDKLSVYNHKGNLIKVKQDKTMNEVLAGDETGKENMM